MKNKFLSKIQKLFHKQEKEKLLTNARKDGSSHKEIVLPKSCFHCGKTKYISKGDICENCKLLKRVVDLLENNRNKNPMPIFSTEFSMWLIKGIEKDVKLPKHFLLEIQSCHNCGGPVDYYRFFNEDPEKSNTCPYCRQQIFKNFTIYFMERGDLDWVSITRNIPSLILREMER